MYNAQRTPRSGPFHIGTHVIYTCRPGSTAGGELTCEEDGQWSCPKPTCIGKLELVFILYLLITIYKRLAHVLDSTVKFTIVLLFVFARLLSTLCSLNFFIKP